jgi:hypothetical protein
MSHTLATASRKTWAFARDRGFPLSEWITKMDHKQAIPFNSVHLTSIFSGLPCLINSAAHLLSALSYPSSYSRFFQPTPCPSAACQLWSCDLGWRDCFGHGDVAGAWKEALHTACRLCEGRKEAQRYDSAHLMYEYYNEYNDSPRMELTL